MVDPSMMGVGQGSPGGAPTNPIGGGLDLSGLLPGNAKHSKKHAHKGKRKHGHAMKGKKKR
jgi:hypothetical protein